MNTELIISKLEQLAVSLRMDAEAIYPFFVERVRIEAITTMSDVDREILLMRIVEGLSYHEVSESLGISVTAAKKRLTRAVIRLQKQIRIE